MNRHLKSRRRFRVVARPRLRAKRLKLFGAFVAVALLGFIAIKSAHHAIRLWPKNLNLLPPLASEAVVIEGVQQPLLGRIQQIVDSTNGSAGNKASAIKKALPCIAEVEILRSWSAKQTTLKPILHHAIAVTVEKGKAKGYLSEGGIIFSAPPGVYSLTDPIVDVTNAAEAELKSLTAQWQILSSTGAFPSTLTSWSYLSAQDGWQAMLSDGTRIIWGHFDWTREKLFRLGEALADAKTKTPGTYLADLRWFEDGKVLLKPIDTSVIGMAHGGFR